MIYVSWCAFYEGVSDAAYFGILIPRIMEDIILDRGTGNATVPPDPAIRFGRGAIELVAQEACAGRDAFRLAFFHADTGGSGLASALPSRSDAYCARMHDFCSWPPVRCITITPRHETEAWILSDPAAVTAALGYTGLPASIGLPSNAREAERLNDPKSVLAEAMAQVRGRRRRPDVSQIFSAIAQRQSFAALRQAGSFIRFQDDLLAGLADLRCI